MTSTLAKTLAPLLISLVGFSSANAAILLEDPSHGMGPKSAAPTSSNSSVASPTSTSKTAANAFALRKIRRAAIGIEGAGALGIGGVNLELCFTPAHSFKGGYGGGQGFQAFDLQYKQIVGGENFLPYFGVGYARWYNSANSSPVTKTTPSLLADRFLNDQQRGSGKFGVNIMYPSVGLQVMQPNGPWAGSSLYAELMLLVDVDEFIAAPTGAVGYAYYF